MKFILFIASVFIVDLTFAQQPKIDNVEIYKDSVLIYKDSGSQNDLSLNMPKSKFLFENNIGKVYRLPLDNMKCLSPNIESNMPVYKGRIELNRLPNPQIKPVPIPNPFSKHPPVFFTEPYRVPLK